MMTPEERDAIRNRDDDAECVRPWCHQSAADRRLLLRELDRLHSWDGLMELLNEHWPDDIFITAPDPEDYHEPLFWADGRRANPGVMITGLIRWLDNMRKDQKAWQREAMDQAHQAERRTTEINALNDQVARLQAERTGDRRPT